MPSPWEWGGLASGTRSGEVGVAGKGNDDGGNWNNVLADAILSVFRQAAKMGSAIRTPKVSKVKPLLRPIIQRRGTWHDPSRCSTKKTRP